MEDGTIFYLSLLLFFLQTDIPSDSAFRVRKEANCSVLMADRMSFPTAEQRVVREAAGTMRPSLEQTALSRCTKRISGGG